jgi:arylsulfatase A-like enzyme
VTGYTTDIVTDMALDWLGQRSDAPGPFLLMLQHKAPHRPWLPAARHLDDFEDTTVPEPETLFETYDGMPRAARLSDMSIALHDDGAGPEAQPMAELNDEQRIPWEAYVRAAATPRSRPRSSKGDDLTRWRYQRYMKDYMRCVKAVDENVGARAGLSRRSGLARNTIVVYASDQGMFLGEHGWFDKRWIYEESLRTPFMVRWPGHARAGSSEARRSSR